MRGAAEQTDTFVGMELNDPPVDFVGMARSFGVKAERAKSVKEATDLLALSIKGRAPMLIDVDMDRAYKPV
jgi:benzoylformate decarboxylase